MKLTPLYPIANNNIKETEKSLLHHDDSQFILLEAWYSTIKSHFGSWFSPIIKLHQFALKSDIIKIGFCLTSKALVKNRRYNNCILKPHEVVSNNSSILPHSFAVGVIGMTGNIVWWMLFFMSSDLSWVVQIRLLFNYSLKFAISTILGVHLFWHMSIFVWEIKYSLTICLTVF